MDILKKALLPELIHRSRQLKKEKQIDAQLSRLPCDDIVREYYQLYREWNRITYQETVDDLWNYRSLTTKNLREINIHQQDLQRYLNSDTSQCEALKNFVEQFKSILGASSLS
uniref:Uncharacterized protein n=1 Tax=Marseillevirus LCMAC202 TaxID=2506606 RepID=A0A481YZ35_9VIRU|nr:MAG: hypothetical protein LCMAC202_06220 [Marseillevirus LCMAC202]